MSRQQEAEGSDSEAGVAISTDSFGKALPGAESAGNLDASRRKSEIASSRMDAGLGQRMRLRRGGRLKMGRN